MRHTLGRNLIAAGVLTGSCALAIGAMHAGLAGLRNPGPGSMAGLVGFTAALAFMVALVSTLASLAVLRFWLTHRGLAAAARFAAPAGAGGFAENDPAFPSYPGHSGISLALVSGDDMTVIEHQLPIMTYAEGDIVKVRRLMACETKRRSFWGRLQHLH